MRGGRCGGLRGGGPGNASSELHGKRRSHSSPPDAPCNISRDNTHDGDPNPYSATSDLIRNPYYVDFAGEEMGDAAGDYLILTVIAGLNVRLGKNPYLAAWKTVVA